MKGASVLLTIWLTVFQSIEREEPIEVDPAPTHAGLENGHAAATGNNITTNLQHVSQREAAQPWLKSFFTEDSHFTHDHQFVCLGLEDYKSITESLCY